MSRLSRLALNDEGFVFDPATGDSFLVNRCGLLILRALNDGKNNKEVIQAVADDYEVSAEDAERDVADFRSQLKSLGIE
ncbi:MAG TPA: HPr-rel-A system PqqD family peptide chaperone [Planctomycetota bacterium]|jgi:PqqD family protein of HPr-rel-A system